MSEAKLKNRRVILRRISPIMYLMQFRRLEDNWKELPKDKRIRKTDIQLTTEAMAALVELYNDGVEIEFAQCLLYAC